MSWQCYLCKEKEIPDELSDYGIANFDFIKVVWQNGKGKVQNVAKKEKLVEENIVLMVISYALIVKILKRGTFAMPSMQEAPRIDSILRVFLKCLSVHSAL